MVKVLVVDDEPDIRYMVRRILNGWGYDAEEAGSGKECLEKLREDRPDLILLDLIMPGMSGWDVLRKIKDDEALKSIPVVMLTSVDPSAEEMMSKEFNELTDYIIKPYASESLLTNVKNIFMPFQITREDRAVVRA